MRSEQSPNALVKGTGRLRNLRTSGDHPDYGIFKIGQNSEKNRGDLRKLAVTQTQVKKPSDNAGMKKSQIIIIIIIIIIIAKLSTLLSRRTTE